MEAVLAQKTGTYFEQPANGALRKYFSWVWVHRLPKEINTPINVVPDGHIDLQWVDEAFRIAGPDHEVHTEAVKPGGIIVGFRFHPGIANEWLGVSAAEMLHSRVSLAEISSRRAKQLADSVGGAEDVARLSNCVKTAMQRCDEVPSTNAARMNQAFRMMSAGVPQNRHVISCLTEALGMSERTLRRRFDEAFGYGPQTLARVLRYQRFLELTRTEPRATVAELAFAAGYADQAHLARESGRMTGMVPSKLLRV